MYKGGAKAQLAQRFRPGKVTEVMGRPLKLHNKKKIQLMVPMTVAMKARLKHQAVMEGRSMSAITRDALSDYLASTKPTTDADVYEEISSRFQEALQS